jgi:Lrp/AsnC family transcriptional regulator, leucine-responsive regulatory protein
MTNIELAQRIGLSPSPCLRRVRSLEDSGVIRGYRAMLDPSAVDRGFDVWVHIDMAVKDRATISAFEHAISGFAEVLECQRMFGAPDYLVRVAVADVAAYERFYMDRLADLPGVGRMNSQFSMKVVKTQEL